DRTRTRLAHRRDIRNGACKDRVVVSRKPRLVAGYIGSWLPGGAPRDEGERTHNLTYLVHPRARIRVSHTGPHRGRNPWTVTSAPTAHSSRYAGHHWGDIRYPPSQC